MYNEDAGRCGEKSAKHIDLAVEWSVSGINEEPAGSFGTLGGVAVDSRNAIYALDYANGLVHVFDAGGGYRFSFGREGTGDARLHAPVDMAIDRSDILYILDDNAVRIFDARGNFLRLLDPGTEYQIKDIGADSRGNVYLTYLDVWNQNVIHKYDPQGGHTLSFCDSYAKDTEEDVRVEIAYAGGSVAVGPDDRIYFTQALPYEIRQYSGTGELLLKIFRENDFMRPPRDYSVTSPHGISLASACFSASIVVLPDGSIINCAYLPEGPDAPAETIVDIYDPGGRLMSTKCFTPCVFLKCADANGKLYGIEMGERFSLLRLALIEE